MHAWFKRPNLHLRRLPLFLVPLSVPFIAAAAGQPQQQSSQDFAHSPGRNDPPTLVQQVHDATRPFVNFNFATLPSPRGGGYIGSTPCVSGPDFGAMGVHVINPDFLGDGEITLEQPEALIYEPQSNGYMTLVGVEYIVKVEDWNTHHPNGPAQPSLQGNLMNLVTAPNRYGLPDFWELHVWAWENNPMGSFADWNTRVTCTKQRVE